MAYSGSCIYKGDIGEYDWTPYGSSYDVVPYQDSTIFSGSEFDEPKLIEYDSTAYDHGLYDPFVTRSEINYSSYSFSEPRLIQYEPSSYVNGYVSSQTQYTISYYASEFNEPEFEEYDPTPYGGGYDPSQFYGKPLPPSDEICYPRSEPLPPGLPSDGFSYGSIPSPYGKDVTSENSTKPPNGSKPTGASEDGQQSSVDADNENGSTSNIEKPILDTDQVEERERHTFGDDRPWTGYDCGDENGKIGGYGYDCGNQVPQPPYGYGLEAIDLCESLFGYWPCLSRKDQKGNGHQQVGDEENSGNPWNETADYIFGSPFGYPEYRNGGGQYGNSSYGRESYYQQQPCYRQDDNDVNSWVQKFNIF